MEEESAREPQGGTERNAGPASPGLAWSRGLLRMLAGPRVTPDAGAILAAPAPAIVAGCVPP